MAQATIDAITILSCSSSALGYQRVTHGISRPNNGHNSMAAACTLILCTAHHNSKACPRVPQSKHWYRPNRTFTENGRLRGFREACTGHGPRHCSPRRTVASNCSRRRTSRIVIRSRSKPKSMPGIVSPPLPPTEKRNRYWNPRLRPRAPPGPTASFAWAATDGPAENRWPPAVSPSWLLPAANARLC